VAYDFTALLTEFYARGFGYLDDGGAGPTRAKRWINDAMHMVDEMEDWSYLQTSTTGTAPLVISDLRKIESVTDTTNHISLTRRSRAELNSEWAGLTIPGLGYSYYVTGGTTINTWPANTSTTLTVNYWKYGPDLSSGSDAPLMPDRFRQCIVDYAVAAGLRDDESADWLVAQQAGDQVVDRMRQWSGMLEPAYTYMPLNGSDC